MSRALPAIPVHTPQVGMEETGNVMRALAENAISGSYGIFIREFEQRFSAYVDARHGVAVSSGTAALQLAAAVIEAQPGDEVLVSASTNIATVVGLVERGAKIIPVDSEPDTWNMDVRLLGDLVTPRTRSIFPVHLYGHPVDMDPVMDLADEYGLYVVEDAAEAHGARYWDNPVGSIGDIGCFSFYSNKIITTGEGGMFVTNDEAMAERARSLRNLAFGQPRFLHNEIGYNYRMTNLQAAIGCGQLSRIEQIIENKRRVAAAYTERLSEVQGLRLPVEMEGARNVYWMYGVVVEPEFGVTRDSLMASLACYGIETRTMFCPLNLQPALLKRGLVDLTVQCPVAEGLWRNGLYLPSSPSLLDIQIDQVCDAIKAIQVKP